MFHESPFANRGGFTQPKGVPHEDAVVRHGCRRTILGATSASAEYREVRIVRDWDHWHHPPWFRHFARWRDCRDITERRYRPDGTVVVRRIHRCD
jgi:hypothetical protein